MQNTAQQSGQTNAPSSAGAATPAGGPFPGGASREEKVPVIAPPPKSAPTEGRGAQQGPADNGLSAEQLQRLERKNKDLSTKAQAMDKELRELRELRESLKSDPYGTVEKMGGSLEGWSRKVLGTPEKDKVEELHEQIKSLSDKLNNKESAEQKAAEEKQIQEFRGNIEKTLADSEEFKALHFAGMAPHVYNVIAEHAAKTADNIEGPEIMDVSDAARIVKEKAIPYLTDMVKKLIELPEFQEFAPKKATVFGHQSVMGNDVAQRPEGESSIPLDRDERLERLRKSFARLQ